MKRLEDRYGEDGNLSGRETGGDVTAFRPATFLYVLFKFLHQTECKPGVLIETLGGGRRDTARSAHLTQLGARDDLAVDRKSGLTSFASAGGYHYAALTGTLRARNPIVA